MRRRTGLGRLLTAGLALVTAASAFAAIASVQPTRAAWNVSKTRVITVTAVTPTAPTNLRCSPTSGTSVTSMQFLWDAPTPAPSGYTISIGGITQTTTGPSYTLNAGLLSLPSSYAVTVTSTYGNWTSGVAGARTLNVTGVNVGSFSYNCT